MKMRSEERKQLLMKSDISVQVKRGGVTETIRGALSRPAGRSRLSGRRKLRAHLVEKQPLWFCAHTTLCLAGLAAFGMGLSVSVRASIMVMLPSMCSGHGRNFLLLMFVSLLVSGPLSNTLENTERAASSLLCGAELAANQTQELMQKAATPLFSVLDHIREISRNAYAVAGRVQNFIYAMTDSIRHVARALRNVLRFLADIGDICNEKMGTPYRKCRSLFEEARSDCSELLGDFNFLCNIVDGFLPLCNLARAGEFFCIVPSYIADHLRKRLAAPVIAVFQKMKREFEFNISASLDFDLDANSSQSLHQMSQSIMSEISSELQVFQKLSGPLAYIGLVLLACSFLRAVQYRHRYLHNIKFDNNYITAQFKDLDQRVTSVGGASVFPITRREAKTYITPLSFQLTYRERRAVMAGLVSVFRHLIIGSLLVALDFLVFWILDQVHHQVTEDIVARVPVTVAVQVNGSGYASDIYRDVVASFNILQRGNITVISKKCLLEPSEPNYNTCFILGFLLGLALLVSLTSGFMQRCRRLICASYHPEREQERIRFLRQQILDQRRGVRRALRRSVGRSTTDPGGGGGRLHALLIRLPGGGRLSHLLGLSTPACCLVCGEVLRLPDLSAVICDAPHCSGVYCRPCFQSLGSTCVICVRPLTFQEDSEEELDSTDDERPSLSSTRQTNAQIKRRIPTARQQSPSGRSGREAERGERPSSDDSVYLDSELSEADLMYQDQPGSGESDSDHSFNSALSEHESLVSVVIHRPDRAQNLQDLPQPSGSLWAPSPGP
ncbi:DC-STAMP domain-containing protein 2-like isoform X2 [Maylandia zebra]|uniref:DC-STAMP domain-containing protein 2 isoform X3 n=1 Tax=Astatotilapia calliptera TaxID=8154 RepID=UPI000E403F3B|nr:DC-STAMP domain-containing protein 2 isoform X3 [Astatotilapia calliptera]